MDDFLIASPMTWDYFVKSFYKANPEQKHPSDLRQLVVPWMRPTSGSPNMWIQPLEPVDPNGRDPGHHRVKSPPRRRDVIGEYH